MSSFKFLSFYFFYSASYTKTGKLINIGITCIIYIHYNFIKLSYNTQQPMQSKSLLGYYDSQQGQNNMGQITQNQMKQQLFNHSRQSSNGQDISGNQSGSNSDFQQCHNQAKKSRVKKWRNPIPSIVPPAPLNLKLIPLLCQDCKQDCYDEQHIQIINYSLRQYRPVRILQTNDMSKRYKMINNLRIRANRYSIKHCVHGTPHLFNGTLQIPMLLSTLKFLDDAHLRTHGDQNQTRRNLHQIPLNIDKRIFRKYLYKYLDECRECKRKKSIFRLPLIPKYRSNIFQSISQISLLKLKLCTNPDNQIQEINHEKPAFFNLRQCFYDCSRDSYQKRFQDILDFICTGKYPQSYNNLSKKDKIKKKQVLRVLASKFRVFNCNSKVPHLWRIPKINPNESFDQPQKVGYQRIPMLHELFLIATKLHTQFGHHSVTRFSQMMRSSGYDRSTLTKYFYNGLNLCSKCEKQKTNNPIVKKNQSKKTLPKYNLKRQAKQENSEQSDGSNISDQQYRNNCRRVPFKREEQVYEQHSHQIESKRQDYKNYKCDMYNDGNNTNQFLNRYEQNPYHSDPVYNYNDSDMIRNYEENKHRPSKINQYSERNSKISQNQRFSNPICKRNQQYEYNTNLNQYQSYNYNCQSYQKTEIKDQKYIPTTNSKYVDYYDDSDEQIKNVSGTDQYNDEYIVLDDQIKQKIKNLQKERFEVILQQNEISMKKLSKILLMSHGMKKKLAMVGESVYFTKVSQLNVLSWSTYIFLGFGRAAEVLILGIFLCIKKKKAGLPSIQVEGDYKDFYFAFSSFFSKCIFLNALPFSLQTDYQCSEATKAIESLIYYTKEAKIKQINHRHSCQSFFEFVQKDLLSQVEFRKVQNNLLNILKTYDQKVYQSEMKYIQKYIQNQVKLQVLKSQFRQICPAFLKPIFIVGKLERGAMKAFNKVINSGRIAKKLPLIQFLRYSLKIQEQIYRSIQQSDPLLNPSPGKAVNLITQRIMSIVPLGTIINVLSSRIASQFLKTLEKAIILNVQKSRDLPTEITVIDIHGNHTVVFNVSFNHWVCSCKRIYLEGLPCQHLLRVAVIEYNGDPLYYINTRWWIEKKAS